MILKALRISQTALAPFCATNILGIPQVHIICEKFSNCGAGLYRRRFFTTESVFYWFCNPNASN